MPTGELRVYQQEEQQPAAAPTPAEEARAARETLGLTVEQLGPELGLTPAVVAAWEAGRMKVPRRILAELRWRAAVQERTRALEASGLPVCSWVTRWHADMEDRPLRERRARLELLVAHSKTCYVCLERERFLADEFPPLPSRPVPGWMGVLGWFGDRIGKLPRWARPAATGSLVFAGYSLVRIILLFPGASAQGAAAATEGFVASVAVGGVVGLLYSGYRGVRERRAR